MSDCLCGFVPIRKLFVSPVIFSFALSILVLQLLKAREYSKGEGKNVNKKGRLKQAIERKPHAEFYSGKKWPYRVLQ
jgi:hypothetical protein